MRRRTLAGYLAAAVIGGAGVAGIALTGPADAERAHPEPSCERDAGVWRCTFPTPGHPAVVMVQAYEDGSARAVVIDNGR